MGEHSRMAKARTPSLGATGRMGARAGSPKPRVDKIARKADYLRAAARVFLSSGSSASMQEVADAAGAPKPVFYRVFPSRAELIDAFFQHVHDTIVETQKGKWDGYGWALRVLYLEAKKDPEIFLVVLKVFRGDPTWEPWRQKLLHLVNKQAETVFRPAEGAPPGGDKRAIAAARTVNAWVFEVLVSWLEDDDGLTDEARFAWWGRIVREWRLATREAFELNAPASSLPARRTRST
ncbi:MAG: TetR family transcriptional regulator [Alphaproteobacteria bacterium]|nr:TetR family transcriptional regulator [Alphaproteobacteria bacterium]